MFYKKCKRKVKFCKKSKPSACYFVTLGIRMKVLKNFQQILTVLTLLIFVNVGVANATEKDGQTQGQEQEQEQDGRRKSDQSLIRPDGETAATPIEDDSHIEESDNVEVSASEDYYRPIEKVDSVKEESVSKYNFIFYFLYKFKYDGEDSP